MLLLPGLRTLVLSILLTVALLGPRAGSLTGAGVSHAAGAVQTGATLTILAAPVELARSGGVEFNVPAQGELLQAGDTVRTGPGGLGLITFFDGSESQLGPDAQLQLERLDASSGVHIALLQTAGVTTNHVVPMRPGSSFQTDTPAAVALVRGTSYVVSVSSLSSVKIKPPVESRQPAPMLAPLDDLAAADLADLAELDDAPEAADAPETTDGTDEQLAAAVGQARALEPAVPAGCGVTNAAQCLITVVLLADPDGRVGRVVVEPRAALAAVELTRPGDLGTTSDRTAAKAQLSALAVQQLQHSARDLHDKQTAAETAPEVELVVQAIEPVVAPSPAQPVASDPLQPVATDAQSAQTPGAAISSPTPGPSSSPGLNVLFVVDSVAVTHAPDVLPQPLGTPVADETTAPVAGPVASSLFEPVASGFEPGTPSGFEPGTPSVSEPGTPSGSEPGTPTGFEPGTPSGFEPVGSPPVGVATASSLSPVSTPDPQKTALVGQTPVVALATDIPVVSPVTAPTPAPINATTPLATPTLASGTPAPATGTPSTALAPLGTPLPTPNTALPPPTSLPSLPTALPGPPSPAPSPSPLPAAPPPSTSSPAPGTSSSPPPSTSSPAPTASPAPSASPVPSASPASTAPSPSPSPAVH
jgi:hypothetical protein